MTGLDPLNIDITDDLQRTLPCKYSLCGISYDTWTNGLGPTYYDDMYTLNSNYTLIWSFQDCPTNVIASWVPEVLNRYPLHWAVEPIIESSTTNCADRIRLFRQTLPNTILMGPALYSDYDPVWMDEFAAFGGFTNLDIISMHDYFHTPGNGDGNYTNFYAPWGPEDYCSPNDNTKAESYWCDTNFTARINWIRSYTNLLRTNYPSVPKVMLTEFGLFVSNSADARTVARTINRESVPVILSSPWARAGATNSFPYSNAFYNSNDTAVVWSPPMLTFIENLRPVNAVTVRIK
jgi:hypothetical protein